MSNKPDPLVPQRKAEIGKLKAEKALQRTAFTAPFSFQLSAFESSPRRWPLVFRVLLWCGIIGLSGISVLGGLVLAGQTELVAWIIVGAVLSIVFGTPLLCVVGLFIFYVWAVTRMGRSRQRSPSTKTGGAQQVAQTIVVGEVVLD
ncbi:MAG: hypothetical protein AB4911_24315 [Oscillochloridaceae bacterium umkhey_bin13]